jgi:hypothetical protein
MLSALHVLSNVLLLTLVRAPQFGKQATIRRVAKSVRGKLGVLSISHISKGGVWIAWVSPPMVSVKGFGFVKLDGKRLDWMIGQVRELGPWLRF